MDQLPDFEIGAEVYHRNLHRAGLYAGIDEVDRATAHVHFPDEDEDRRVSRRFLSALMPGQRHLLEPNQ